jgi:hypothetical protein
MRLRRLTMRYSEPGGSIAVESLRSVRRVAELGLLGEHLSSTVSIGGMFERLRNWSLRNRCRRRTFREGSIVSQFIACDVRRDISVVSLPGSTKHLHETTIVAVYKRVRDHHLRRGRKEEGKAWQQPPSPQDDRVTQQPSAALRLLERSRPVLTDRCRRPA